MAHNVGNYRSPVFSEPRIMAGASNSLLQTPLGNVRSNQTLNSLPPPLPPPISGQSNSYLVGGGNPYMGYNSYNSYSPMYNSYGGGFGGYGGFGSGYGSYGGGYGSYNRFGGQSMSPLDPETRFIQLAEESSRPAFQSIESLVGAIGNIAAMLDSTFFALTSSFRAILGVAANFGRLRGVFAQFWSTFAIFRGLNWLYRKLLYMLKISNIDPASTAFKEAFAAAAQGGGAAGLPPNLHRPSPWPVVAFLGFIFTAPYLIMKLLNTVTNTAFEESRNPKTWICPIKSVAIYSFQPRSADEILIRAGQTVLIAPKEIQNTNKLMNTGWALATVDGKTSGLIPITYVQGPNQINRDPTSQNISNNIQEVSKDFDFPNENSAPITESFEPAFDITTNLETSISQELPAIVEEVTTPPCQESVENVDH